MTLREEMFPLGSNGLNRQGSPGRLTGSVKTWLLLFSEAMRSVFFHPVERGFRGSWGVEFYPTPHFIPEGIFSFMHGGRILGRRCIYFSYLILIYQIDNFGGLCWAEAAWYEWVHWLPLWWPANSSSVISDKLCQT